MPNPKFLQTAKRWMNEDTPEDESRAPTKSKPAPTSDVQFPTKVDSSFLLEYNDFGGELITKANERFKGTQAEIPSGNSGEVQNIHLLKRLGLITTIYNNPQLKSGNVWPITPLQSEQLLKDGKMPNPQSYWEDLALILYDRNGINSKEAKALYESLKRNRDQLSLSNSDLENRLLIISPGIEKDEKMPNGVKPIILPGLTKVFMPEVLTKAGKHKFEYGLDNGLPYTNSLKKGNRTFYLPDEKADIGLRVLCRGGSLVLYAWNRFLTDSNSGGRVRFAPQGAR